MGWSYETRAKRQTINDYFRANVLDGLIDGEVCGTNNGYGVWYGVATYNGRNFAYVALIDNFDKSGLVRPNFGYKMMSEEMGHYNYDMPERLFKLLSPLTSEDSKYAANWRKHVAERIAAPID